MALSAEVHAERLSKAFAELRAGGKQTETLGKYSVRCDALRVLAHEAKLLRILVDKGRTSIYDYPDPESEEGKIEIQLMGQFLAENSRVAIRKKKKIPQPLAHPEKIEQTTPPKFLQASATENVIKWATMILMEVQAPLGKSTPAGFVREMVQKDVIIADLRKEISELKAELEVWNKQVERIVKRRESKDAGKEGA